MEDLSLSDDRVVYELNVDDENSDLRHLFSLHSLMLKLNSMILRMILGRVLKQSGL